MAEQDGGKLVYEVDIDVAPLLSGSNKAKAELGSLGDAAQEVAPGFEKLSKGAKGVSSALAMPEVNKLSAKLAQLSGKLGASSESAAKATDEQNKFHGALSTVASQLGAGYVSNVGSATAALIKHAKEAVAATNAQLENAVAAQKEATALQASASQLVINAAGEKKLAEAATQAAAAELQVAEAVFARKEADIASLEALLMRQKESLRQSEANLQITNSEKAVSQALRDRNAVEITQNKILKQSNQAVKEVTAAEDRVKAAKTASATASEKLTQSMALEAAAVATVAKANDAATMATERLTVASKVQAAAVSGARSALSLLGGPSGILLLAAAGVYSLYQAMNDTSGIDKYKQEIDDAARRIEYLTKVQADAASAKTKIRLDIDKQSLKDAENDVEAIKNSINTIKSISGSPKLIAELEKDLTLAKEKSSEFAESVRVANERIGQFTQQAQKAGDASTAIAIANETYDKSMKGVIESNEILEKAIHGSLAAAEEMAAEKSLRKALAETGVSADETERQVSKLKAALAQKTELTFEQELKSVEQNIAALRLEMVRGKQAAIEYRATIAAANKGLDPEQTKMYVDAKKEEYELTQKLSEQKKKGTSDRSSAKRDANAAEGVAQKLARLKQQSELAADSTRDLSREQAMLRAEQSLGKSASTEQIKQAREYAAATWDTANAIKMRQQAEQAGKFVEQVVSAAKVSRDPYTGEAEDPVAQVNEEEQRKLAALNKYQQLGVVTAQQYEDAKTAIAKRASDERSQIVKDENQRQVDNMNMLLGGVSAGFDGLANIVAKAAGDNSSAYKVLFAVSKGFAVAQSALNLQLAISNAMASGPFPWNLANMASVAAAGGGLISAIGGISYSGARYNGGPVSADSMYRVGEKGKPEIYQASNGNQFMIPGDNGRVISNKDMHGAGGGNGAVIQQTNYFTIQSSTGNPQELAKQIADISYQQSLRAIKEQSTRPRGMIQPRK